MEGAQQCPFCRKVVNGTNYDLHIARCERMQQKQDINKPIPNQQSQQFHPMGSQQMSSEKPGQNQSISRPSKQPIFGNQNQRDSAQQAQNKPNSDENINDVESDEKKIPVIERPNGTISYYHPLDPSQLAQSNLWMEDIKCPNCNEKLTMNTIASHVETCQFREDPCQFCGQSFPLYLLQEHLDVCEKAQETYTQQQQRRSHLRSRIDDSIDRNNQEFQRNTQPIGTNQRQGYPRQQQQQQQQRMQEVPPQQQPSSDPFQFMNMFNQRGQNIQRPNRIFNDQNQAPRFPSNNMSQQRTFINGQEVFDSSQPQGRIIMNGRDITSLISGNRNPSQMDPFQMLMAALILGHHGNIDPSNNGGFSEDQMKQFPEHEFHQQNGLNPDQCKCTICMSDFEENEKVKILDCMHSYHSECIDTWLKKNTTCPVCKKDMREFVDEN